MTYVNTFLFSGDELGKYFNNSSNTVRDTIDTFSGITKIQNLSDDIDITFKTMKRGSRIMITAHNQMGSQTKDHYSLLGFTKAYNATKANCS